MSRESNFILFHNKIIHRRSSIHPSHHAWLQFLRQRKEGGSINSHFSLSLSYLWHLPYLWYYKISEDEMPYRYGRMISYLLPIVLRCFCELTYYLGTAASLVWGGLIRTRYSFVCIYTHTQGNMFIMFRLWVCYVFMNFGAGWTCLLRRTIQSASKHIETVGSSSKMPWMHACVRVCVLLWSWFGSEVKLTWNSFSTFRMHVRVHVAFSASSFVASSYVRPAFLEAPWEWPVVCCDYHHHHHHSSWLSCLFLVSFWPRLS